MSNKTNSPVMIPYQYGSGLLPSFDWEFAASWNFADTMARAPMTDFGIDVSEFRTPITSGGAKMSGRYGCCGGNPRFWSDCIGAAEVDLIARHSGTWQPLVVYRDETGCGGECSEDCGCPSETRTGRWLWTMAKLVDYQYSKSIDFYLKQSEPESFTFILAEPFREVTHHFFRYGSVPPLSARMTIRQVEELIEVDRREFFYPITVPGCCSAPRWWYKDWKNLFCIDYDDLAVEERYSKYGFPGDIYTFNGEFVMDIKGTADPEYFIHADYSGDVTVNNDQGEFAFYASSGKTYTKSDVFLDNNIVSASPEFRLAPGQNSFISNGRIKVGVIPRWL